MRTKSWECALVVLSVFRPPRRERPDLSNDTLPAGIRPGYREARLPIPPVLAEECVST